MHLNNLYTFSKDNSNEVIYRVILNANHPLYKGHFPNEAVTPGAILLQILKDLLENHLGKSLSLIQCSNVKFLSIVDPNVNDELFYKLEIDTNSDEYYIKNITSFKEGDIVLKCNATFVEKRDQ